MSVFQLIFDHIVIDQAILPVIGFLKSRLKPVFYSVFGLVGMRDKVRRLVRPLVQNFLLDKLVFATLLKQNLCLRRVWVHWNETEVVILAEFLVELLNIVGSFFTEEKGVEMGINDKDYAPFQNVVVCLVFVDWLWHLKLFEFWSFSYFVFYD